MLAIPSRNLAQESQQAETVNQADSQVTYGSVQSLLRHLESDELSQRDAAEAKLIELGSTVLQFLPSVTPQTSGEMKIRLQRIRQALERVQTADFFKASTITLSGSTTVSEALTRITKQTDNKLRLQTDNDSTDEPSIGVDWNDTPFWTAIQDVLMKANLRVAATAAANRELILGTSYSENPATYSVAGPFRIELAAIESRQNFDSRVDGQTRVHLLIMWEPRLQPLFVQLPMSGFRATLPGGSQIAAVNPQASPEVRLNPGASIARVEVQMQRPARDVAKLESLVGQLVVSIPGDRHPFTFEKIGNGVRQSQKHGDLSVTLESARRNGPVFETRLFVEFGDAAGALESYRGWIMSNEAYVLDAKGSRIESVGFQTYATTNNGAGVSYLFQISDIPDSFKLVYESPSVIVRQTINFELDGIPLP